MKQIRTLMIAFGAALFGTTIPAQAQEARPAPEYFVQTVMATTTAQQLAVSCPTLSFDITAAAQASGTVIERLRLDGFTPDRLEIEMLDPSDRIGVLQQGFLEKHALSVAPDQEKVCAAGTAEIAQGTSIGAFLNQVAP